MKYIGRILKWSLIGTTALVAAVWSCWVLLPDEALSPEARQLLAPPAMPPAGENACFTLLALRASPELDPHLVGQEIARVAEQQQRVVADSKIFDIDPFLGPQRLSEDSLGERRCDIEVQHCLPAYQRRQAEIAADVRGLDVYMARYRSLRNRPHWAEPATRTLRSPFPDYVTLGRLSELEDATIAIQTADPATRQAALSSLADELVLWRRMLREADSLVSQMIAVAFCHRQYRLLAEMVDEYPSIVDSDPQLLLSASSPIAISEVNFPRVMKGEFSFIANTFRGIEQDFADAKDLFQSEDRFLQPGREIAGWYGVWLFV